MSRETGVKGLSSRDRRTVLKTGFSLFAGLLTAGCSGNGSGSDPQGNDGSKTANDSQTAKPTSTEAETSTSGTTQTGTSESQGNSNNYSDPNESSAEKEIQSIYQNQGYHWAEWESLDGFNLPENVEELSIDPSNGNKDSELLLANFYELFNSDTGAESGYLGLKHQEEGSKLLISTGYVTPDGPGTAKHDWEYDQAEVDKFFSEYVESVDDASDGFPSELLS